MNLSKRYCFCIFNTHHAVHQQEGYEIVSDNNRLHGAEQTSTRKLALVSGINLVGFVIELAGGVLFGSVALMGDAVHMLFDALAYVMALIAASIAQRYRPSSRWSYGLHRLEPLAAFLNGVLLIPMVGFVVYESYQRFLNPVGIETGGTIILAIGGLLINVFSVYVLRGDEMSLNERGAFYHLLGDTGASVAVIISMLVIRYIGFTVIDPITAVLIALIVIWSAIEILRGSAAIFLGRSPVATDEVTAIVESTEGVNEVEDIHLWHISSSILIASLYIADDASTLEESDAIKERVHAVLNEEFGVTHATIEAVGHRSSYNRMSSLGRDMW